MGKVMPFSVCQKFYANFMNLGIHIHTLLTGNNATLVSGRIQHSEKASNFPSWLLSFAFTIFLTHLVIRDFVRKSADFSFQENIPFACASLDTALWNEITNYLLVIIN